jgi:phage-related tail fiber protein
MEVRIYANVCALMTNEDGTISGWWISGVYDVDGNIRNTWKFPKGYKAEADLQPDNTVIIKFEP